MELNIEYCYVQTCKEAMETYRRFFENLKMPGVVNGTAEKFIRNFSR